AVYDVATGTWSEIVLGLPAGTAAIASDGSRYVYLASGSTFVRLDPSSRQVTPLAPPPFAFAPNGGLRRLDGLLYGHRGGGTADFAAYDVATDAWTVLPSLPGGAVLGAAIDPEAREYFTY